MQWIVRIIKLLKNEIFPLSLSLLIQFKGSLKAPSFGEKATFATRVLSKVGFQWNKSEMAATEFLLSFG
jgi:hypothetical protein